MVEDDELKVARAGSCLADEEVTRVWIGVNEALLEDHVDENLRDQLRQVLQIEALLMHVFDSSHREASFI